MDAFTLSHVALAARDRDAACRFLEVSLGLRRTDLALGDRSVPFFGVGRSAVAVFASGDPYLDEPRTPGVHHMALCADDPQDAAERYGLPMAGRGNGPAGHVYVAVEPTATNGIRTRLVEPLSVLSHPGAVTRIDHLGIASTDLEACRRVFVARLGCKLESTETDIELRNVIESFVSDKYGAVYHSRPPEILGGLRAMFITVGDCELEIMADYDPDIVPQQGLGKVEGNTRSDRSAIANFIARRGPGLAHVAFQTSDIDALLARLAGEGWRLIDRVGRPGGRGSRIAFVHPANFGGGLLIHFVEPRKRPGSEDK